MPQKSKASKGAISSQNTATSAAETTQTLRKNYEAALRTGQRLQEEGGQWWARMVSQTQTASAADWQKQFTKMASLAGSMLPLAQQRMEEICDWTSKNAQASTELMQKAMEVAQAPVTAESQAKWLELWMSSLRALQSNIEKAGQVGTNAIDGWLEFLRQQTEIARIRTA